MRNVRFSIAGLNGALAANKYKITTYIINIYIQSRYYGKV